MDKFFTLELSDMAYGGEAVGRAGGKAVFVPLGAPGDSVRVEIVQDKGRFAHARLLEVLSPSPQRVQPPCPYFGSCGGCRFCGRDGAMSGRQRQATMDPPGSSAGTC